MSLSSAARSIDEGRPLNRGGSSAWMDIHADHVNFGIMVFAEEPAVGRRVKPRVYAVRRGLLTFMTIRLLPDLVCHEDER